MESKKMNRRENKARGRIARRTIFLILLLILGVSTVLAGFANPTVSITSVSQTSVYRGSSTTISGNYGSGQGNFLKFDAIDDYVKVVNSASLQPTSAITIEAWIYPTPPHQQIYGGIINNINGYAYSRLLVTNSQQLLAQVYIRGSYQEVYGPYITNNRWNQVVYVYNGTHEYWVANGVKGSVYAKTGSINTGTYNMTIGWGYTGTVYHFNGSIAHVRIYNRSLSDSEILNNFRNPNSPVTNGLVLWLKMNEGTGTTVYDYSGNNNNGAVYNGASLGATWVTSASPVTSVYVNITSPAGAVITNGLATLSNPLQNGTWSYTFATTASSVLGSYSVSVKALDLSGNISTASLSNAFSVLNNPPVIQDKGVDPSVRTVNSTLKVWVKATDFETPTLTATALITAPDSTQTSLTLNYNSTAQRYENTFTPTKTGTYTIQFTVKDADSATATASYSFTATAAPVISNAFVKPATAQRPANVTVYAYISDPDTPDNSLTVYAKMNGKSSRMVPNGTLHWFYTIFSFSTTDSLGYYDVYINATDGIYFANKTFSKVFTLQNAKPSVSSVTASPSNITQGNTVKLSVSAYDPDSPAGSLSVVITVESPAGDKYYLTAGWDGQYYTAYFTTSLSSALGQYFAYAIATDPLGDQGGPASCYFYVNRNPPTISYMKLSTASPLVNSTVYVGVLPYEPGIDSSLFTCTVFIGADKVKAEWNGKEFVASYNPVKTGYYSVRAICTDPFGISASQEQNNAFYASLPMQSTAKVKPQSSVPFSIPFNITIFGSLSSLLSPVTDAIKMLIANTELFMSAILVIAVAFLILNGRSKGGKRRRKR